MQKRKSSLVLVASFLLLAVIALSILYIVVQAKRITLSAGDPGSSGTERQFNILVTGTSGGEAFMRQVFRGAQSAAQKHNCAIEFYIPETQAEGVSTQVLFDYASYIDCDGVIAFVEESQGELVVPLHRDGRIIPLVTVGHYSPDLPQISYIGVNYSELGKIIAEEIILCTGGSGNVYVLDSENPNDTNYSVLMNVLLNITEKQDGLFVKTISAGKKSPFSTGLSREDSVRQSFASAGNLEMVVSLSESNTVLASQTITDLNRVGKTTIIGFSDGADSRSYYEKGIITELVLVNSIEIGRRAVEEIFEYMKTGYANSYIIADIDILKRGGSR